MQIYRLLPLMVESGFIHESKLWKRNYYIPAHPDKIEQEYEKKIKDNKHNLNELKEKFNSLDSDTNIVFKKWRTGIKNVYNDIINTLWHNDTYYRITSETDVNRIKEHYQPYDYIKKRDDKEIERMIITSEKTSKLKVPKLERDIKIIENNIDMFDDNISFTIYWEKLSFIDFNTETSIIIESPELSWFFKKVFKILYKKL
jgi:sugar-specific transcriptional regulator TrmB